jgi:hypothetical protein
MLIIVMNWGQMREKNIFPYNMLSSYFYQYFASVNPVKLREELKQPQLKKPDAYKSINSSSVILKK